MSLYVYEIVLSCSLNCKFISSVLHLYPPLLMISGFVRIFVCGWIPTFSVYMPFWWALSFAVFLFLVVPFSILPREVPSVFVVKLVWCCWIVLAFAYLWSFWLLLQIWMRALLGRVILVGSFFPFITLSISCHSLGAGRVSAEKSANNLIGVPLYVICFLSLAAFNIFSVFNFGQFD